MNDSASASSEQFWENGSEGQEWTQEEIEQMVSNTTNIEADEQYSIEWEFGEGLRVEGPDPSEVEKIYIAITQHSDL